MTTSTGPGGTPDPLLGGAGAPSSSGPPTGSSSGGGKKEQAQQAAGAAKDEGKQVAGTAKEEAGNVAAEAKTQARNLLEELKTQAGEQSRTGQERLASLLRELGDELKEMASQSSSSGFASDLARQAADRTHSVSSFMEQREPGDLVDEVRRFAGRRPGAFLLGALAAGVVAGRVTRGATKAHGVGPDSPDTPETTGAVAPVGTSGTAVRPPVGAPADTGVTAGGVATGPGVDPVEPGYGGVPVPGSTRPGGTAP